jgi:hypothetical protein
VLLRTILPNKGLIPIVRLRITHPSQKNQRQNLSDHLLNFRRDGQPQENPRLPAMVDNWIRLGLVSVSYAEHLVDDQSYSWVDLRPEYKRLAAENEGKDWEFGFAKGFMAPTPLGRQFAKAVGIV